MLQVADGVEVEFDDSLRQHLLRFPRFLHNSYAVLGRILSAGACADQVGVRHVS
jgi:hypothetical protein